jgi:hypothetical protein
LLSILHAFRDRVERERVRQRHDVPHELLDASIARDVFDKRTIDF